MSDMLGSMIPVMVLKVRNLKRNGHQVYLEWFMGGTYQNIGPTFLVFV